MKNVSRESCASFRNSEFRVSDLHGDVCDMTEYSFDDNRYFITFVGELNIVVFLLGSCRQSFRNHVTVGHVTFREPIPTSY